MKDGRTRMAYTAEHAVDPETGAVVGVTVQDASEGDTTTMVETLVTAAEQVEAVLPAGGGVAEVVADKGYHSNETMVALSDLGLRSYVSGPDRGRRRWPGQHAARDAVYANSLVGEHYLTRTLPTGASVAVSAAAPAAPAPADLPRPAPPEMDVTELPIAGLRDLAEAGDAAAQTELGERYEHTRGVEQDYGVAVSWFRRASEQGHAPAQAALGFLYARGLGVPQDDAEAVRWSRRAAEQGRARAQHNLGVLFRDGRGVSQDYDEAVRWFRRAAEQGHAGGQNSLGAMYGTGRGVERNDAEAIYWYRRAAEQEHALAQNNLGVRYRDGRGVSRGPRSGRVLVPPFRRAGACRRPEQSRQDVRDRPGRTAGSRRSCPLVPSGSPVGA